MYFSVVCFHSWQGLSRKEYEEKKEVVAIGIIRRLEKELFPGLQDSIVLKEVLILAFHVAILWTYIETV